MGKQKMSYQINLGGWNSVFAVPSAVVDRHLKLAGAAQLKVLLGMLRHAGEAFEAETIATALSMQSADVRDAMQYWAETGLMAFSGDTIVPAQAGAAGTQLSTPSAAYPVRSRAETPSSPPSDAAEHRPRPLSRPQKPDSAYVARRVGESQELSFLMQEAQVILGRPISGGDAATLVLIHENDGLPVDVIVMLLQYAVSIGKGSMRYIEKVAISWAEEEIDSHEKAEQKIRSLGERKKAWSLVLKTIGMEQRSPTSREDEATNRWVNEWHFGPELIREAYERCVDAKGKYIVSYADSILRRWQSEGVHTLEQAPAERQETRSKQSSQDRKPSYDIEAYEKISIFDELELQGQVKK